MKSCRLATAGFTLLETMVATFIVLLALGLALTGFLYTVRSQNFVDAQNELDLDSQVSLERLKRDLRLSSLNEILYWPQSNATYWAMSFPLAYDDDGDGSVEVDSNSRIIWDETVIYHMWMSLPNPSELRVTRLRPRCQTASQQQRQKQLNDVVANGNAYSSVCRLPGENATTETIFVNLFDWSIKPQGARFDGRWPTNMSSPMMDLGSYVMTPGPHILEFRPWITNNQPSKACIGLDLLKVTACSMAREAEGLLYNTNSLTSSGTTSYFLSPGQEGLAVISAGTLRREEIGGNLAWSGNQHIFFSPNSTFGTASATGFSLRIQNDVWHDNSFQSLAAVMSNTVVSYETNYPVYAPRKYAVKLSGMATNWTAAGQSGDSAGFGSSSNAYKGAAIRVLLRGADMADGGAIDLSGRRCIVGIKGGATQFSVQRMWIAECRSNDVASMDAKLGGMTPMTFVGAADTAGSGEVLETDWCTFPIDKNKSYLVTMLVKPVGGQGSPYVWTGPGDRMNTWVIPGDYNPTETVASDPTWSAYATGTNYPVLATNLIIGVNSMRVNYPEKGIYISPACDTGEPTPAYTNYWMVTLSASGNSVVFRVRSGSDEKMSDAPGWYSGSGVYACSMSGVGTVSSLSLSSVQPKRYVQYMLELSSDATGMTTPVVGDVKLGWTGQTRVVNVGGQFSMGPNYGIWEMTIDGTNVLKSGIQIDATLYKYLRGFKTSGEQKVMSNVSIEVTPRNTGK